MKIKKKILLTIAVVSLYSCSDKYGTINEIFLNGQKVKTDINEGKMPIWMFSDRIYARDTAYNICSGILTKTKWHKAEKILSSGHGHNEFGMIALAQDNMETLYVLDRPWEGSILLSLTKILHTDKSEKVKDPQYWEKYELRKLPPFVQFSDNFEVLSDSTIIVPGAPSNDMNHLFSIINFKNQTLVPLDYWPDNDTPYDQRNEKLLVYTEGCDIKSNGKGRFLYWDNSGRVASIFSIDKTDINVVSHIYNDVLPTPSSGKTPLTERVYCCSDSSNIYLLYKDSNCKGEKLEKFDKTDPFPMGNTIEIYDWDGVKRQIIRLDKYGRVIMLSKDSKTLYLYSEYMNDGSDPYIYSYDLSSIK